MTPDPFLEREWEFATSADIHERNSRWGAYVYYCRKDDIPMAMRYERYMRAMIARHRLGERDIRIPWTTFLQQEKENETKEN